VYWQLSRAGLREHVRGLKMTASMASEPAANIVAPEQVALKVTAQRGRVITAHLDEDMTGGAFHAFCSSVFSILSQPSLALIV